MTTHPDPDDDFFLRGEVKPPSPKPTEALAGVLRRLEGANDLLDRTIANYGDPYHNSYDTLRWVMLAATFIFPSTSEVHKLIQSRNWAEAARRVARFQTIRVGTLPNRAAEMCTALRSVLETLT